jgi:hypothetical protein
MQSSGNLSDVLSGIVNFRLKSLIHKEDSSDSIPVNLELFIKNQLMILLIDPCKSLPTCDTVGQETSQLFLAEIVNPKSPHKSIETAFSISMEGQQNKGKGVDCANTDPTSSPRVLQNKYKPKMLKPKKPGIGVCKTIESKGHSKHQRKTPKYNETLPLSLKDKRMSVMLVGLKFPNVQNILHERSSIIKIME